MSPRPADETKSEPVVKLGEGLYMIRPIGYLVGIEIEIEPEENMDALSCFAFKIEGSFPDDCTVKSVRALYRELET